jgi:Mg2+ and Co2+ transporter CorA
MAQTQDTRGAEIEQQRAIINQKQKEYLRDLQKEREDKVKAATTYQKLLDSQLKSLRQRSLESLEDTMAAKEKEMNAVLLKKYGIPIKK